MLSYSQRDPKWADYKLGDSNLSIGRFGCTTTSIADLSTYFLDNLNPLEVSKKIKYTQGLVIWSSCVFHHFRFERREYGRNDANIIRALKDPNKAVILNVAQGSHWVVATQATNPFGIADPWLGDRSTMARYKNNITGAAYFTK
jgi:hypothetical protein